MAHYSNLRSRNSPEIEPVSSHIDERNGEEHWDDTRYDPVPLASTWKTAVEHLEPHNASPKTSRKKLTKNFLLWGGLRWLLAATLSVLYYVVIRVYQGRTLTSGQKSILDALFVGLSVAMGLNIATALKEIATHMRWWFLDKEQTEICEIDITSLVSLLGLLWQSRKPMLKVCCAVWILLSIAVQVAISVLSLTYKADPGVEDIYLDVQQDLVAIPDMSHFVAQGRFQDGPTLQSYAAHILGDIGSSYNYSMLPEEPLTDQPIAKYPSSFWSATDHWEYAFVNSAPSQVPRDFNFLSVYSNQSITSSATCQTPPYDFMLNDTTQTITIQHRGPETRKTITFPNFGISEEEIIYLTKPFSNDEIQTQSDKTGHCGPGCSTIHILEPRAGPPAEDSFANPDSIFFYYECNTTVSPKGGVPRAGQFNFSATNAAIAAQAIALSGRVTRGPEGSVYTPYNLGLPFGEGQNNSAAGMATMVSRFAIGVVAAAAQTNPKILVPGRPPKQGVRLVLDKPAAFAAIIGATLGVHLVLFALAVVVVAGVQD